MNESQEFALLEKYNGYEFIVCKVIDGTYTYQLFGDIDEVIHSGEYFETEQETRFAVIGHITNLENGE